MSGWRHLPHPGISLWVQPVFGLISNYCHIPIYPGLSIQIQANWTLGCFTMPPTPAPLPAFVLIFPMLWILVYHHSWLNLSSWKPNSNDCSLKEPSLVLPHSCPHSFLTTGVLLAFATSVACSKLRFLRTAKLSSSIHVHSYVVIQFLSHIWLSATPWTAPRQASLSFTLSWVCSLMSIESVMPSNHLILWCPLLGPSVFPSIRVFSNESVLHIRWPNYWSFSFSISPSSEYSGLISFRIDWFDLAVQGTLKSSPAPQFILYLLI